MALSLRVTQEDRTEPSPKEQKCAKKPGMLPENITLESARSVKTLYLVDASGFIFRAYHALPALTSAKGIPTGAVLGFCNMLSKVIEEGAPDYLAAVFDTGKPTFRHALFGQYKANRPPPPEDLVPQFAWIEKIVEAYRIPLLRHEGYEADDLIATLATKAREAGIEVAIVSSDKDLMQLVGPGAYLLDTMKNQRFGADEVTARFGVRPDQLGDWLALCGDSSDNVPGIPGIGPKTATKLLLEYGDLATLLASAESVSSPKLRESLVRYADQAQLSRRLVQLDHTCPLSITLEELHRDVRAPVVEQPTIERGADVGVVDGARAACLANEPSQRDPIHAPLWEHLQGDATRRLAVEGFVDDPAATAPELVPDLVTRIDDSPLFHPSPPSAEDSSSSRARRSPR